MRDRIILRLNDQGFILSEDKNKILSTDSSKSEIRNLHKSSKELKLKKDKKFIQENFKRCLPYFADGCELKPHSFDPRIIPIDNKHKSHKIYSSVFRIAKHLWSVPVSEGFGRRQRFLVIDKSNGKLVGLFALCDPVFNLRLRDDLMRRIRLYNIMDVFVLGAIPPYSNLLCGKLVALLSVSNDVREYIYQKYIGQKTIIANEIKNPKLALISTSSALGRSSIYNRIKFNGRSVFKSLGYSQGWGHFHLSDGTYDLMKEYLVATDNPIVKRNRFGQGPNWKMRVIRICLEALGLSANLLRHGIQREIFVAPLCENYKKYLTFRDDKLIEYNYQASEFIDYFKYRWFIPRFERDKSYFDIKKDDYLSSIVEFSKGK